jgi:hypothetical protein
VLLAAEFAGGSMALIGSNDLQLTLGVDRNARLSSF